LIQLIIEFFNKNNILIVREAKRLETVDFCRMNVIRLNSF